MEPLDMNYLCTILGNLSGIPIRLYSHGREVFYHSLIRLPKDPLIIYREEVLSIREHVGYFVTKQCSYYGIVNSHGTTLVIGPSCQVLGNDQELRELAFSADVAPEDTEEFVMGMKSIGRMPIESILQMLCTINYILNGEKLELKDITIFEAEQSSLKKLLEQQRSDLAFAHPSAAPPTHSNVHNTYELEQRLLQMIRKGDTAALKEWIASAPAVRGGTLAADQLRQIKNTFVVTATLASRAAIEGGMAAEDAFTQSDAFIQRCELLTSMNQITNLQYYMVLEFSDCVERIRLGRQPTQLTLAVTNYIRHHLSKPIRVEEVAKELFMSRPYLSAKFKEETGETLTDFILKQKTEEAKRLLRYSNKPATAIGSYLGFSSQSHFTRVFKKYAKRTPSEYREKYGK